MRSTIRTMCAKREALTRDIAQCITDLSNVCPLVLVTSIRSKIRELNHCLYESLSNTKRNKLASLTGVTLTSHHHNHIDVSRSVVTIPQDLSLSDVEKSVLSKGLNFIPISKKSDQFQVNKDAESFLRRVRIQAFFANCPTNNLANKDVFQALNPVSPIGFCLMDNSLPLICLLTNVAVIFVTSTLIGSLITLISLKKNGLLSTHFVIVAMLLLNRSIRAVLLLCGALISTKWRLFDSYPTLTFIPGLTRISHLPTKS